MYFYMRFDSYINVRYVEFIYCIHRDQIQDKIEGILHFVTIIRFRDEYSLLGCVLLCLKYPCDIAKMIFVI